MYVCVCALANCVTVGTIGALVHERYTSSTCLSCAGNNSTVAATAAAALEKLLKFSAYAILV